MHIASKYTYSFRLHNNTYTVWRKILTGEIVTNGHMENFDEKIIDEFHNVNAHIY